MASSSYLLCSVLLLCCFINNSSTQPFLLTNTDVEVGPPIGDERFYIEIRKTNMDPDLIDLSTQILTYLYASYDNTEEISVYLSEYFMLATPHGSWSSIVVCKSRAIYVKNFTLLVVHIDGVETNSYLLFTTRN